MSEQQESRPYQIVMKMMENDAFSQWMGVEVHEVREGFCRISCRITDKMTNGFGVSHGGILFSLADSALAFSASSYGRVSLAIDNSVSFTRKSEAGETITATSECLNLTGRTGTFQVKIMNEKEQLLAVMKGTVYRTDEEFEL